MYIRHNKRLFDTKIQPVKIVPTIQKRLVESTFIDDSGILRKRVEYKTVNRQDEMKNYKVSDFTLDNYIALGVPLNGNITMSHQNSMNVVDSLGSALESMTAYAESAHEEAMNNNPINEEI